MSFLTGTAGKMRTRYGFILRVVVVVVVKLYFNTVIPFRRKTIQIILKRDKKGNYTN